MLHNKTMRTIIFIFSLLIFGLPSFSQYGNEWVDFDKTYYKFQISETGIYRIPTSVLSTTGLDLIGDDFQLFYKGKEIPIYVTTSSTFGAADYIEFYGEQNDGEFDTQLFANSSKQTNAELSLFTDKSTYFLTSNVGANKRYEETINTITNPPAKLNYYMQDSYQIEKSNFHFGEPYYTAGAYSFFSTFDEGEGFVSPIIRNIEREVDTNGDGVSDTFLANVGFNHAVFTDNVYADSPEKARVTARVVGRNSSTAVNFDKHIAIGLIKSNQVDTIVYVQDSFQKFEVKQFNFKIAPQHLNTEPDNITGRAISKINFRAYDGQKFGWFFETRYSLALLKMTYPRDFNFNNEEYFEFNLDVDETTYIEIENFNGGSDAVLYDLTDGKRYIPVVADGVYKFQIEPESNLNRKFVIFNGGNSNSHIQEITELTTRLFVDYGDPTNQGQYLIITNELLRGGATDEIERYKNYRESVQGGSHDVIVAHIDELYDQFAWGIEKHPMAIKNYINYIYNKSPNSEKPEFVNIIGKGVRYEKTRFDDVPFDDCLVPAYGYTATDLMFTTVTTQDYLPRVSIGRIPAKTPDEVRAYLDKVLEYEAWITDTRTCETIQDRAWMKNAIHIAKGWGTNETNNFQANLDEYKEIMEGQKLNYKVVEDFQDITGAIPSNLENNYEPSPGIKTRMEEGLAFINYVGHSAPKENYWQFDMQHPNAYNNEGKYPFIFSNSCFVGKINDFYDRTCMAEDYTVTDNRGAIGFLAAVALSSPSFLHLFSEIFIQNISEKYYTKSIGENIKNTIVEIHDASDYGIRIVCNEFILSGDPAVKLYHWEDPEFSLENSVINVFPDGIIDRSVINELTVDFDIENFGQVADEMVDVVISQYAPNGDLVNQITQTANIPSGIENYTFTVPIPANSPIGVNSFVFKVDGNDNYSEDCEENNIAERFVTITCENPENDCDTTGTVVDTTGTVIDTTATSIFEITGMDMKVGPSPANSFLNFYLEMEKEANLKIELLSVDGKLIDEVVNDYYSAGQSVINYNVNDLNNGLYLYRISIDNEFKTGRITIIK